jgi:hypothetical protein
MLSSMKMVLMRCDSRRYERAVVRSFSVKNTGRVSTYRIAYSRVLMFPVPDTVRVAGGARGQQLTAWCA